MWCAEIQLGWQLRRLHRILPGYFRVEGEPERCDSKKAPDTTTGVHDRIRQACQGLSDLARDIQALSHRLHSSKLEYLGLVTTARSFCHDLSEQRHVRIDFKHSDIPAAVPKEISLC